MFDILVNIIPREGDMIIIKDGHFIMAVSVLDGEIDHIYHSQAEYQKMTGMTFSDFVEASCIGTDGITFFYWMDA